MSNCQANRPQGYSQLGVFKARASANHKHCTAAAEAGSLNSITAAMIYRYAAII